MKITLLTKENLAQAFVLEKQVHSHPWSQSVFYSNSGENYLNLKITQHEKLIGYVISQYLLDEATLFNIAIDKDCQGKGYGNRLLSSLIVRLKEQLIATLWLEVRVSNNSAIRLYRSLGFNEVTIRHHYYPTKNGREDALIMALYL